MTTASSHASSIVFPSTQTPAAPEEAEWHAVALFRGFLGVYLRILRCTSEPNAQKFISGESLCCLLALDIVCAIAYLMSSLHERGTFVFAAVPFVIALCAAGVHCYVLAAAGDGDMVKTWVEVFGRGISAILFLSCVVFVVHLLVHDETNNAYTVIVLLFLNLGVLSHLLWDALLLFSVLAFIFEATVRLMLCRLRRPSSRRGELSLLLVLCPGLCGQRRAEVLPEPIVYSTENGSAAAKDCRICLGPFAAGERLRQLSCHSDHIFHPECLDQWLRARRMCPICRSIIV